MRCPTCAALNPESADWCSQCYVALRIETPRPPSAPAEPATPPVPPPAVAVPQPTSPAAGPGTEIALGEESSDGRFRRTEDGLDWRCAVCSEWNPLDLLSCAVCGAGFGRAVGATGAADDLTPMTEGTATVMTAVLPGLAHVMVGRSAAGYLRMALYVVLLLGGVLLVRAAASAGQSILPGIPMVIGALTVLVVSILEAPRLAGGDDTPILTGRFVLWLVVGVLGALMASFLLATLEATGGA